MGNNGGMGFWQWLILAIVVLVLFGLGPCASCDCGAKVEIGKQQQIL